MSVTEEPKRKLSLKRETVASFLPEGTKASVQGRVQFKTRTSTECGTAASNTNDGSGTYCTCC